MAIDLSESLISFAEAANLLPRRRRGRKPTLSCVYRWSRQGCRGVILETVQVGGTRCTSREAVERFLSALTGEHSPPSSGTRTSRQRSRAHQQAIRVAERAGL